MNISRNPRGFQVYGHSVTTDYGHRVALYESSGAGKGPVCWMSVVKDTMRGPGDVPLCDVAVHMTYAQAVEIRDRFNAFIEAAVAGETCE